jgi:hypothetical protein
MAMSAVAMGIAMEVDDMAIGMVVMADIAMEVDMEMAVRLLMLGGSDLLR